MSLRRALEDFVRTEESHNERVQLACGSQVHQRGNTEYPRGTTLDLIEAHHI